VCGRDGRDGRCERWSSTRTGRTGRERTERDGRERTVRNKLESCVSPVSTYATRGPVDAADIASINCPLKGWGIARSIPRGQRIDPRMMRAARSTESAEKTAVSFLGFPSNRSRPAGTDRKML
jgi:hypothetical protein